MQHLNLSAVKSFRRIDSQFRPHRATEMRDLLRSELGKTYEVAGTQHYLVCAPRGRAKQYAPIFEDIYRTFHGYFSTRGFRIPSPEFPLVAIIFQNRKSFHAYLSRNGMRLNSAMLGYYLPMSNRVLLYETGAPGASTSGRSLAAIPDNLRDNMVHEATHQVAYNTGLHSRIGDNSRWVVEGLATVFEAPSIRNTSSGATSKSRINRGRYIDFQNFAEKRRKPVSLEDFVASDSMLQSSTSNFYSQAWALSSYLVETRPSQYAKYLKRIAERDPLKSYSSKQQVADFKEVFDEDLEWLEVSFLRYMQRLK